MNYSIEKIQDIVLIELSGDSWGGLDAYQMKDEISAIIAMGSRRFLADFDQAHFVNSAGIGVLVACWVSIRNAEGEFKFCEIGPRVARAFEVAGVAPLGRHDHVDRHVEGQEPQGARDEEEQAKEQQRIPHDSSSPLGQPPSHTRSGMGAPASSAARSGTDRARTWPGAHAGAYL